MKTATLSALGIRTLLTGPENRRRSGSRIPGLARNVGVIGAGLFEREAHEFAAPMQAAP